MSPEILLESLVVGVRLFILLTVPILLGLALAGTLAGFFQAITGVREELINYFTKLIALFTILYFSLGSLTQSLQEMFNNYYQ